MLLSYLPKSVFILYTIYNNKEMATTFYNIYINCVKHSNSTNYVNWDEYYDNFIFFAKKYIDHKKTTAVK